MTSAKKTFQAIQDRIRSTMLASCRCKHAQRHRRVADLSGSRNSKRTWGEWVSEVARDVGFKAAMGVSSLGLGGAAVSEKQATAGIISDFGNYDAYRVRGAATSVAEGGNDATFVLTSELGTLRWPTVDGRANL
jgi:hypothetical protein